MKPDWTPFQGLPKTYTVDEWNDIFRDLFQVLNPDAMEDGHTIGIGIIKENFAPNVGVVDNDVLAASSVTGSGSGKASAEKTVIRGKSIAGAELDDGAVNEARILAENLDASGQKVVVYRAHYIGTTDENKQPVDDFGAAYAYYVGTLAGTTLHTLAPDRFTDRAGRTLTVFPSNYIVVIDITHDGSDPQPFHPVVQKSESELKVYFELFGNDTSTRTVTIAIFKLGNR